MKRAVILLGASLVLVLFLGLGSLFAADERSSPARVELVVWGLPSGEETKGLDAQIRAFEIQYPHIRVTNMSLGAGSMNAQKLMTSIVGGVPPDLVRQDRFTIGDWASRDTFMPLDGFLNDPRLNNPDEGRYIKEDDFYTACWAEAVYHGHVFAIPDSTDDRLLFWNKDLFRQAGLDPERPPRTWEELLEYSQKLTKRRPDGTFETIGFIPVVPSFSNSWFYLYSWQNEGYFMSADGRTCTLNNPDSVEALQWLVEFYDQFEGAESIMSFASTFQPQELDPFITGRMAMKIDTNGAIRNVARFGKDLDFGTAPGPVPAARLRGEGKFAGVEPYITWSGGFSLAIPHGSRHPEEAWLFIKWMTSYEGLAAFHEAQREWNHQNNRPYVPGMSANQTINERIFREYLPQDDSPLSRRLRAGTRVGLDMMPKSRFRPVTFVGQRLWDEHVRAYDQAIHHKMSPEEALAAGQRVVQAELEKVFRRDEAALLDWRVPLGIVGLLLLIGAAMAWRFIKRSGWRSSVGRKEALAGYLFVTPWVLGFLIFTAGPMLASLVFAFCEYDVLHPPRFVGLRNFESLLGFSNLKLHWMEEISGIEHWWNAFETTRYLGVTADFSDHISYRSLYNVIYLSAIGIPLSMVVSLGLAMLLNTQVKGMSFYRTVYYLPAITPVLAVALLWPWILNPDSGVLNQVWRATLTQWFAWAPPPWLAGENWSKPAYILVGLWSAGGAMILWLAGLQGIPKTLYEAAEIDGAGWLARLRTVTLPMLTPYIFFNLIMGTIGSLQRFTDIYVMSGPAGGPVDSTMVPVLYLFSNAFQYFKMGYASAWAWVLFVIVLLLTLAQLKMAPRWVHYEAEKK